MDPEEFRKRSEEYKRLAHEAERSEVRLLMLSIAESWAKLAEQSDKDRAETSPAPSPPEESAESNPPKNDRKTEDPREQ